MNCSCIVPYSCYLSWGEMEVTHVSATSLHSCNFHPRIPPSSLLNTFSNGNVPCFKKQNRIRCLRKQHHVFPAVIRKMDDKLKYRTNGRAFEPCMATSDDSGRAVSGESILLNEQTLERELQIAIEKENYVEAAKIRDKIRVLQENSEASVLAVNARFYNAFRIGDLASMQALWVKGDNACCVHPGASGISGYDLAMRSWEYVWADYEFPLEIELRDVQVHVRGDVGYVTCIELVKTKGSSWGRQFATNVFERIDGHWFICVHHASPVDL